MRDVERGSAFLVIDRSWTHDEACSSWVREGGTGRVHGNPTERLGRHRDVLAGPVSGPRRCLQTSCPSFALRRLGRKGLNDKKDKHCSGAHIVTESMTTPA